MPSFSNLLLGCVASVANSCLLNRISSAFFNLNVVSNDEQIENFAIKRYSHHPKCHLRLLRTKKLVHICFFRIDVIVFFCFCTLFVLQIPLCWSACAWVLVRTIFSHVLIFSQISFIAEFVHTEIISNPHSQSLSSASQSQWNSNGK